MLISRRLRQLHRFSRRIWVRATLYCLMGFVSALLALALKRYIPEDLSAKIGASAVEDVLNVLATSMLAVTTFSLSIIVTGYGSAATTVTPRATQLLVEDVSTQSMLSAFIGSFLYSIVGIVLLKTGLYGDEGRVVLFAMTILVIFLVTATLLRWINRLSSFGRLSDTMTMIERATTEALETRAQWPFMGCRPFRDASALPRAAEPIRERRFGYVQHIDYSSLDDIAEAAGGSIWLAAQPGDFVGPAAPCCWTVGVAQDDKLRRAVCDALTVEDQRSFDQDPRFGLSVMAEAASRALSPAVNDPGTAQIAVTRQLRALTQWTRRPTERDAELLYPNLRAPGLDCAVLLESAFRPIARDGAGVPEVGATLMSAFDALAQLGDAEMADAARALAAETADRFEAGLTLEADRARLRAAAAPLLNQGAPAR